MIQKYDFQRLFLFNLIFLSTFFTLYLFNYRKPKSVYILPFWGCVLCWGITRIFNCIQNMFSQICGHFFIADKFSIFEIFSNIVSLPKFHFCAKMYANFLEFSYFPQNSYGSFQRIFNTIKKPMKNLMKKFHKKIVKISIK